MRRAYANVVTGTKDVLAGATRTAPKCISRRDPSALDAFRHACQIRGAGLPSVLGRYPAQAADETVSDGGPPTWRGPPPICIPLRAISSPSRRPALLSSSPSHATEVSGVAQGFKGNRYGKFPAVPGRDPLGAARTFFCPARAPRRARCRAPQGRGQGRPHLPSRRAAAPQPLAPGAPRAQHGAVQRGQGRATATARGAHRRVVRPGLVRCVNTDQPSAHRRLAARDSVSAGPRSLCTLNCCNRRFGSAQPLPWPPAFSAFFCAVAIAVAHPPRPGSRPAAFWKGESHAGAAALHESISARRSRHGGLAPPDRGRCCASRPALVSSDASTVLLADISACDLDRPK